MLLIQQDLQEVVSAGTPPWEGGGWSDVSSTSQGWAKEGWNTPALRVFGRSQPYLGFLASRTERIIAEASSLWYFVMTALEK